METDRPNSSQNYDAASRPERDASHSSLSADWLDEQETLNARPHRPHPEYLAATDEEYDRGIDWWTSRYCKFCGAPIQKLGVWPFRRWRHVR